MAPLSPDVARRRDQLRVVGPTGGAPLVRVRGVHKRYGPIAALDGLHLDVESGESLGLLGPNGAGKSTLMHLLAGVIRHDYGELQLRDDAGPQGSQTGRLRIGLAPQNLALYPQLTAAENLRFFARVHGVPGAQLAARVAAGLELADLGPRASDRVATFSGGMARRLNLACSVLHEPQLLLLDEPTAGVDPQSRQHLYESITALRGAGLTVVISTHLIDEAERLCDRVAVMDHGRVRDVGSPAALCERHGSRDLHGVLLQLTGRELRD